MCLSLVQLSFIAVSIMVPDYSVMSVCLNFLLCQRGVLANKDKLELSTIYAIRIVLDLMVFH